MQPKKIKDGETLREGCYYRILEIDPHDPDPSMRVGAIVLCAAERPGCIDPESHEDDGMGTQWFADYSLNDDGEFTYRTLVNGLEFVSEPRAVVTGGGVDG